MDEVFEIPEVALNEGDIAIDKSGSFLVIKLLMFSDDADYTKALCEGPWVINGAYLLVQKWTPDFRVSNGIVTSTIVWIRLPELPLQYYSVKLLLLRLGQLSKLIIILDHGRFARVAVTINLNEPQVSMLKIDNEIQKVEYENLIDICFAYGRIGHSDIHRPHKNSTNTSANKGGGIPDSNFVAAEDNLTVLPSNLNPELHSVVGKERRVPLSIRPAISDMHIEGVVASEQNVGQYSSRPPDESNAFVKENSDFIHVDGSQMLHSDGLINVEDDGAKSPSFLRSLKCFLQLHKPSMVVFLEPRISYTLVDSCISKIGYARSHRVEANGFSGGIRILWQKKWSVEILVNHSQFVHMRICEKDKFLSFFTAVYAHPSITIRNRVWPLLQLINDNIQNPWLVMGDFNSLLSSSERRGGSVNRSGICKPFQEWFTNSNLIDIGYKGPDFTWKRGLFAS
ncbi:hypothetical protein K2173_003549 [Erythroxylum novogranatense]|uniref:DUF4283 domain-containing protein n=1 Tax=Erythroxylum novogranatense TaxID=1862640 RepID=A0AAV8TAB6_9ROSI|nr:hypothetical protein K2173_003549 [Erythroxylum novogranatense]